MSSTHPYYRKRPPGPFHVIRNVSDGASVDLKYVRLPLGGVANTVAEAARRFDARTAEFVRASAGNVFTLLASGQPIEDTDLLELKDHQFAAPQTREPTNRLLAVLAYREYFPYVDRAGRLQAMASDAILAADPGWCGSIGPAIHDAPTYASVDSPGDYDLAQMRLLPMAYRYYDELTPPAQEHLILVLLATGRIHRVDEDDRVTSGGAPNDWSRAGYVSPLGIHIRIAETENHILQIHTARYLTNQLLYQRDHDPNHDNRRNGSDDSPTCMNLMLRLLRNFLRDDFSEYNAKPYLHETRTALLNLCSYAYDHEVRLAARMVLDYVSAHIAVSSCDLRRLVPFRRRNEGVNSKLLGESGFMDVGLVEWQTGSDHAIEHFVVQAGNTRAYETVTPIELAPVMPGKNEEETRKIEKDNVRSEPWTILGGGGDGMSEGLSDYRLPPSIHDLFLNDRHRSFFQTLNRTPQGDVESGQNSTDSEIYAGSPSYLISAGGQPATYAIDPSIAAILSPSTVAQELGVAVTTSFMPTSGRTGDTRGAYRAGTQNYSQDLIQFGSFAQLSTQDLIQFGLFGQEPAIVANYGVAPDFACGHVVHLPPWVQWSAQHARFFFVDMGSTEPGTPGFFLAFLRDGDFTVMEAHDTWLDPTGLTFPDFCTGVYNKNGALRLKNYQDAFYFMTNRNRVHFSIWNDGSTSFGARVYSVKTPAEVAAESNAPPGFLGPPTDVPFLSGTIMNSPAEAVVEITNPALETKIVLDMHDQAHPKRLSETGEFEEAGSQNEVWVDFDSDRPEEGDFFHPFRTVAAAAAAVADNGVIKIVPGSTRERPRLSLHKRVRIEAAIGGVTIGRR
jgi:hypothetical protein